MIQFQNFTKINYLHFINCNFEYIQLHNSFLIEFEAQLDKLLFYTTYIFDVFLYQSLFIELDQVRDNLVIKDMNISNLEMRNSWFFSNTATHKVKILF